MHLKGTGKYVSHDLAQSFSAVFGFQADFNEKAMAQHASEFSSACVKYTTWNAAHTLLQSGLYA
jgi:hypothetical protein